MVKMVNLFDSEIKVMEILWKYHEVSAKEIAKILNKEIGWSKTTTYTVIKKCIDKGAIGRKEPNFMCYPLISVDQVRASEIEKLVSKLYNGSTDLLIASLVHTNKLTKDDFEKLMLLTEEPKE